MRNREKRGGGLLRRLFGNDSSQGEEDASPGDLADVFKLAMRRNAGSVAVITTAVGKKMAGFTSTSFDSLSVDPPTVFFGMGNEASAYDLLFEAGQFAVNILGETQADVAALFADKARRDRRFKDVAWSKTASGVPTLQTATAATIECRVHSHLRAFTHTIVIGAVEKVRLGGAEPLIYVNAGYARGVRLAGGDGQSAGA